MCGSEPRTAVGGAIRRNPAGSVSVVWDIKNILIFLLVMHFYIHFHWIIFLWNDIWFRKKLYLIFLGRKNAMPRFLIHLCRWKVKRLELCTVFSLLKILFHRENSFGLFHENSINVSSWNNIIGNHHLLLNTTLSHDYTYFGKLFGNKYRICCRRKILFHF